MSNRIVIQIDGKESGILAESLLAVVQHTLGVARIVARQIDPGNRKLGQWLIVDASKRNPFELVAEGREVGTRYVIQTTLMSIRALEEWNGQTDFPADLEPILPTTKKLVKPLNDGVARITISSDGIGSVQPTQRLAANVDRILEELQRHYELEASVEGRLEAINLHDTREFCIFDEMTDRRVKCTFPEEMYQRVISLLRHRVLVYGEAKFDRRTDSPVEINAIEIEPLDESGDELSLKDIPPMDFTGGLSSEEYIRRLRDD